MSQKFDYDVFLSHSSKDKPIVRELAERLKADGLRVWFDEWIIKAGDPISLKIQQGIEHSRTLVMCMSPDFFASEWAKLEHHSLLFRDPTNQQRRFIPLLLADCQIPDMIAQFKYIDWREKNIENYRELIDVWNNNEQKTDSIPDNQNSLLNVKKEREKRVNDKSIKKYKTECLKVLKGHSDIVWGVAVTPNGERIISGSGDNTIRVWDSDSFKCLAILKGHEDSVLAVTTTPDGKQVISSSFDGIIKIWDLETYKCLATLSEANKGIRWIAVSPDSKKLVSGCYDRNIHVWDLDSYKSIAILNGHSSWVFGVAITPDGKKIVSSSVDKTIRIWDLDSYECLQY